MTQPGVNGRAAQRRLRISSVLAVALAFVIVAGGLWPATAIEAADVPVTIEVLSSRADLVSSDDALVSVKVASGRESEQLIIRLEGRDVTGDFESVGAGRFDGLVTGLRLGENMITATLPDGSGARLTITNHPNGGPVFAGPQVQPWGCDAGATDSQCNRPVEFAFKYRSTDDDSGFRDYDVDDPPDDVATTTTDQGHTVPFIVRVETGVQNRDYYNIAVLFDPAQPWEPWAPQRAWNRKVVFTHGAGCGMGYNQFNGVAGAGALDEYPLSRGFAVMAAALNDSGHNCNLAVQAEAMMMGKEHLIETYGKIRYAFGHGISGGAVAQQWIANAYPGLYDGIIVGLSFPDIGTTAVEIEDCALLRSYFDYPARWAPGVAWTEAAQAAAAGHQQARVCLTWARVYRFSNLWDPKATTHDTVGAPAVGLGLGVAPTALGGCDAPRDQVYEPTLRPDGVRCSLQDYNVAIMGRRAADGFANRPFANVGVQYGLAALNSGALSPGQFVDLNAKIGSHDIDYVWQPGRVAADQTAVENSYRSGFVNSASAMDDVAIIDVRDPNVEEIHHQFRSWSLRARLDEANGHHGNQAIWYDSGSINEAIDVMDSWLAAVETDTSDRTRAEKLVANRPSEAGDRCGEADGADLTMLECTGVEDGSPRMAAGDALTDDTLDCQLVPLRRSRYSVEFTDAQWAQLEAAFPDGVCDYSRPGVGQAPSVPWQTYAAGPGGQSLGKASVSEPFGPGGGPFGGVAGDGAPAPQPPTSGNREGAPAAVPATGGGAALAAVALLGLAVAGRRTLLR